MSVQSDLQMYVEQTWISERGGGSSHDSGHQGVGLTEGGIGYMQPLYSNAVEGCVVQHHNSICIQGEALQSEQGVVGLHHHVAGLILVGKHTADRVMSSQQGARTVYHCKAFAGHGTSVMRYGAWHRDPDADRLTTCCSQNSVAACWELHNAYERACSIKQSPAGFTLRIQVLHCSFLQFTELL